MQKNISAHIFRILQEKGWRHEIVALKFSQPLPTNTVHVPLTQGGYRCQGRIGRIPKQLQWFSLLWRRLVLERLL